MIFLPGMIMFVTWFQLKEVTGSKIYRCDTSFFQSSRTKGTAPIQGGYREEVGLKKRLPGRWGFGMR
jgi:hypothetical protein